MPKRRTRAATATAEPTTDAMRAALAPVHSGEVLREEFLVPLRLTP